MRQSYFYCYCPKCRNKIQHTMYYGDPHAICPKCGEPFLDPWIIELAFFSKDWYVKHHRKTLVLLAILIVYFLALMLVSSLETELLNWEGFGTIGIIARIYFLAICYNLYAGNTTRISVNEAGFDKNYYESQLRLSDPVYKEELLNSKYYEQMVKNIMH